MKHKTFLIKTDNMLSSLYAYLHVLPLYRRESHTNLNQSVTKSIYYGQLITNKVFQRLHMIFLTLIEIKVKKEGQILYLSYII
jgi:hypothetical protein